VKEIILKGRLNGPQRLRLGKLLNMLYMPSELAKAVGFTVRQVYRVYIPAGCPCVRDERRHVWINGREFAEWYEANYPKPTSTDEEAFCLTCKKPVKMINSSNSKKGRLSYVVGNCSNCGRRISRILDKDRLDDKS